MKNKQQFWAIQAESVLGKLLCWQSKKGCLYFANSVKGYKQAPAPTLFITKKEATKALKNVNEKSPDVKQFARVVEATYTKVVKISILVHKK